MDAISNVNQQVNVTSMQQQETSSSEATTTVQTQKAPTISTNEGVEENSQRKITSTEEVQDVVNKLNDAISPLNTDLKFGVDNDDVFFVSVIESKTNKMIRRFPVEDAVVFYRKWKKYLGYFLIQKVSLDNYLN